MLAVIKVIFDTILFDQLIHMCIREQKAHYIVYLIKIIVFGKIGTDALRYVLIKHVNCITMCRRLTTFCILSVPLSKRVTYLHFVEGWLNAMYAHMIIQNAWDLRKEIINIKVG